ncbi:maker383 [Drosophila busckii]|uniref:CG15357 n=1 Tax=Drosophila busckii TaxID=30019 RepID=A0A0M4EDK8_DROBS|nr:CG15357 [Drosophila busckii]ALC37993.1 CG15357 [Drosophila busckii]ALC38000.1 maker383 [Drosophila busckii]
MGEVQRLLDELSQTLCKFREMRRVAMINLLNQVRCCECGHKKRLLCAVQQTPKKQQRKSCSSNVSRLLTACLSLMLLLTIYGGHLARRYNHVRAYGSNACGSTFFYTYTDCDVCV